MKKHLLLPFLFACLIVACSKSNYDKDVLRKKVDAFVQVDLKSDLIRELSDSDKKALSLFFDAAVIMDDLFWLQAYGDKNELLSKIRDTSLKSFILINYGPWERLNGNKPFMKGYGEKPAGANFYPVSMSQGAFDSLADPLKTSLYSLIISGENNGLTVIPYHEAFKPQLEKVSLLLKEASQYCHNENLKKYLNLRAEALLNDNYFASDMAWMDMKDNNIDFVIGPIENYEDKLFGYKTSYEAYVLIKDLFWSKKLEKIIAYLPQLQRELPVPPEYKKEMPGAGSDLGAYDAVYYAGDCNAGSKTIAINLPNDEKVHLEKGSRRLQLKNSMKFKFDKILLPISDELIENEQKKYISFDAFFENVMFHEIAHGLGIKNTIDGKMTAREALKDNYTALEEAKADILGLFLITRLAGINALDNNELIDNYTTFLAGIFRSVRFGAASAHGKANMVTFNYFAEQKAFSVDPITGKYSVNFDNMQKAIENLAGLIIKIQGDGDYQASADLLEKYGNMTPALQEKLKHLESKNIPVDLRFNQGKKVVGIE